MEHVIVLVDDEPNVVAALKRSLRREPYRILTATSADEALELLRANRIDVVVSDQDMPGMRGTELLSQVRQEFPETIRFMLTGKPTLEVAIQSINDGAISRFFTKPCNDADLAATIRQALDHKDLMAESKRLLRTVKRQSTLIDSLEKEYPGITEVKKDASGALVLEEPADAAELTREIRSELKRIEEAA